jgi:hypothetical protein
MSATPEPSLTEIAGELYVLTPGEFIAARDARAKALHSPTLAAEVRALRKPLMAAWIVNLFARERSDELDGALRLAEELREAQAELDAAALSALGRQRRTLTRTLTSRAADLATERGERVTPSTRDAIEQTLTAAMFDPQAAAAVASGRLVHPLEAGGSYPLGLEEAVAGDLDTSVEPAARPADEVRARRERREIERKVRDAERATQRAEKEQADAEDRVRDADERARTLAAQEKDLESELTRVRREAERVRNERTELDLARAASAEAAEAARLAEENARADLAP